MKTRIITLLLSIAAISIIARIIPPFQSWKHLEKWSSSIIVVVAGHPIPPPQGVEILDAPKSDFSITVRSVLMGTNNVPNARLETDHELKTGQAYLVFSHDFDSGTYNAWEDYRVLPLGFKFSPDLIQGRPLDEQLQILFQLAVDNLNEEIAKTQAERDRIQAGIIKK